MCIRDRYWAARLAVEVLGWCADEDDERDKEPLVEVNENEEEAAQK